MQTRLYIVFRTPKTLLQWIANEFPELGVLCTFIAPKTVHTAKEVGFKYIMFDSGAYTAWTKNVVIDIDKYIRFVRDELLVIQNVEIIPVNLDVIGNAEASKKNWDYITSHDIWVMPVYHAGSPIEFLDYYVERSEYVGLGGMARDAGRLDYIFSNLDRVFERYPDHKFHLFGINNFEILSRYACFSADALTWVSGTRFGEVVTPWGRFRIGRKGKHDSLDMKSAGIDDWLRQHGIEYPLPDDFDFYELDKINIRVLFDEIVKKGKQLRNNSYEISLW